MAGALAGVVLDERQNFGYTHWLSACRDSGLTLTSLVVFTFELLPTGIIGLLLGGSAVQILGVLLRRNPCAVQVTLAAHSGCVIAMAAGLLLCTLSVAQSIPIGFPWLLGAEALLAVLAATWLLRRIRKATYPNAGKCVVGPISVARAAPENFPVSGGTKQ